MIRTIQIRDTDEAIRRGYRVILITRYSGAVTHLIQDGRMEWMPDLAPSTQLMRKVTYFKKEGQWNKETFSKLFVPEFMQETTALRFRKALNTIYERSAAGENIALACFCGNIEMCHRGIVLGLLQAAGAKTAGPDFSPYWILHRKYLVEQTLRGGK